MTRVGYVTMALTAVATAIAQIALWTCLEKMDAESGRLID
jgi:hypothetical protein